MAKKKNKKSLKRKSAPIAPKKEVQPIVPFFTSGFWKTNWLQISIICVIPLLLYAQSINFGYVLDDQIVITDNAFTKKGIDGIGDLMTTESMTGYFGEQKNLVQGNRYRPLSLITFAIEHEIAGGMEPGTSHLLNIILYALTGILLFRVLLMLFRKKQSSHWWLAIPFLASLFFVTHPIHSEAVANIKGRDEILALLLSLSTLYASLRYMDKKNILWMLSSCVLFFLALLAKENSITFLAVIPLSIYFFSEHKWLDNFKLLGALLFTTLLYLALRFNVAGIPEFGQEITDLMNNPFLEMSGNEKMATIMFTLFKYIQLYIFPHPLTHDYYPYAIPILGWGDLRSLGSLLLYIGLAFWAFRGLRKKRISSYAILFYLSTLTIVSNIVINLGTFMNERFIYMASVGLSILAAYLISDKLAKWKGKTGLMAASALTALLVIGYSLKTVTRVPDWESALSLNQSAVSNGSNSARANSFMATALYNEGRESGGDEKIAMLDQAYAYADKAVSIYPRYLNGNLMKAGVAAELYKISRDEKLLLDRFAEVMAKRPDVPYINEYLEYLEPRTTDLQYLKNWYVETCLDEVMIQSRQQKWALHYLNRAYKLDKQNVNVLEALATVYNRMGDQARSNQFLQMAQAAK
ncbi:MAG: hypothetical protein P1U56_21655 [Saprospiraceae bacterium]|nr:hypothetical protein [Saprospiraceae bacterium]